MQDENSLPKSWVAGYEDSLPSGYLELLKAEHTAKKIYFFNASCFPGILQTEAYARAVLKQVGRSVLSPNSQDERVKVRMRRQRNLFERPNPPRLYVLLDEAVLSRRVGGVHTLLDQLHHLLDLARLPTVHLRILPFNAGIVWPVVGMAPFIVCHTPITQLLSIENGFLDQKNSTNEVEATYYSMLFDDLWEKSLSYEDSLRIVRNHIKTLESEILGASS